MRARWTSRMNQTGDAACSYSHGTAAGAAVAGSSCLGRTGSTHWARIHGACRCSRIHGLEAGQARFRRGHCAAAAPVPSTDWAPTGGKRIAGRVRCAGDGRRRCCCPCSSQGPGGLRLSWGWICWREGLRRTFGKEEAGSLPEKTFRETSGFGQTGLEVEALGGHMALAAAAGEAAMDCLEGSSHSHLSTGRPGHSWRRCSLAGSVHSAAGQSESARPSCNPQSCRRSPRSCSQRTRPGGNSCRGREAAVFAPGAHGPRGSTPSVADH